MEYVLIVLAILIILVILAWISLRIKPKPFSTYPRQTPPIGNRSATRQFTRAGNQILPTDLRKPGPRHHFRRHLRKG